MITKTDAISNIEAALNAAIQKGVFADMQSAAYLFKCLQVLKNDTGNVDNSNSE